MAHVFISYSHKDKEYAHKLAEELKRWGIEAWIDDRIDYGSQWPRVIQENLDSCPGFIVIMSSNSYNSDWVQNEVSYAQANKKVMFPVLLHGKAWVSFAAKQYADVRNGEMPPNKYFETVKKQLGLQIIQMQPEHGVRKKTKPSDAERLSDRIVDHILAAIMKDSDGEWEIGLFQISYQRPKKNPPPWLKDHNYYSLGAETKIINTDLLSRYDPNTFLDYKTNYDRIIQNKNPSVFEPSSYQYIIDIGKLVERLNLKLFISSQVEFVKKDVQGFANQLIEIHQAHHIPISEIKIKVI